MFAFANHCPLSDPGPGAASLGVQLQPSGLSPSDSGKQSHMSWDLLEGQSGTSRSTHMAKINARCVKYQNSLCKSLSSVPFRSWGCIDGLATSALCLVSSQWQAKPHELGLVEKQVEKETDQVAGLKWHLQGSSGLHTYIYIYIYITSTCKMCQDVKIACKSLPLQITVLFPILGLGLHRWACNCSPLACLLATVASKATWVGTCWRAKVAHPDLHTWRKWMQDVSSIKIPCKGWPLQITVLYAIPILGLHRWACSCSPLACLLATVASKARWVGTWWETCAKEAGQFGGSK